MAVPAGDHQYGSYITLADVKDYMQWSSPTSPSERDGVMQRFVDMACTQVQRRINRPASSQEFFERHDGWSGEYILLKESPVLELVSCSEWMSSGGAVQLTESTPENPVDGVQIDYATGRIMRTFAGYSWPRPFFPGSRNIEIVYRAGFNPTPPDLWIATVELVVHWWRNAQGSAGKGFGGQIGGQGGFDPESETAGLWQGLPYRIAEILDTYRLPAIG